MIELASHSGPRPRLHLGNLRTCRHDTTSSTYEAFSTSFKHAMALGTSLLPSKIDDISFPLGPDGSSTAEWISRTWYFRMQHGSVRREPRSVGGIGKRHRHR